MTATTTQYVVDANRSLAKVVMETDGSGVVTAKYTYGDDLLKVGRGGGDYYYFHDGLGSTRLITDTSGTVKNRNTYDAYGTTLSGETEEAIANEYLFAGERVDKDTGLVYLRARYHDPALGRFVQLDTWRGNIGDPLSLHRYAYVSDDPTNFVDPTGHFEISLTGTQLVMGIVASLAFWIYWQVAVVPYLKEAIKELPYTLPETRRTTTSSPDPWEEPDKSVDPIPPLPRTRDRDNDGRKTYYIDKVGPYPNIARHVEDAIALRPQFNVLTRGRSGLRIINRRNVIPTASAGTDEQGNQLSWDEYPFASTVEGGNPATIHIVKVPLQENSDHGNDLNYFYNYLDFIDPVNAGDKFNVRVITTVSPGFAYWRR